MTDGGSPSTASWRKLADADGKAISKGNPVPVSSTSHTATDVEGLGYVNVGTTAVQIVFSGTTEAIIITADPINTGNIFIGKSDVTNTGANAMAILIPGTPFTIDYDDTSNPLYVVSDTAGQKVVVGAAK